MIKKRAVKNEFTKNVLVLMTGTTVAQAIPTAMTPVLTRMYSPEDFGVLALFLAITTIVGAVANGRYELAIMLPENDDDAINIAALGMLIASVLSILLFVPVFVFNEAISQSLNTPSIGYWLYFVPVVVWLLGLHNVLSYLNNRVRCYKDMAKAAVYKSVAQASVQLGIGAVKATAGGLISGQIVSNMVSNTRLAVNAKRRYKIGAVSWEVMKAQAKRYVDFPKYSMWASLSNTLSYQLLNMLITVFYSVSTLGFYSLAQRMLGMPTSLVGDSIGRVYFQQATLEKQLTGKAINIFNSTAKKLLSLSFLIFVPLYFVLPVIFEFAFGEQWRIAGVYAQLVLPVFAFRFVCAALSTTNSVFEKQRLSLIWQIALLVLSVAVFLLSGYLGLSFEIFLRVYTIVVSLHYIVLLYILKSVSYARL